MSLKIFGDDRKYFAIVFFILVAVLVLGFINPYLIEKKERYWPQELSNRIAEIHSGVNEKFKSENLRLLKVNEALKRSLSPILEDNSKVLVFKIIDIITAGDFKLYPIQILSPDGKIIAWNSELLVPENNFFPLNAPVGETYFLHTDLITYLHLFDTLSSEKGTYYYSVGLPVEKNYKIQNEYYVELSLTETLISEYKTQFEIAYNPFTPKSKDGRKFSFELLNNKEKKIGLVTFLKPQLSAELNSINDLTNKLQSLLIIVGILFVGLGFRKDWKGLSSRSLKLFILTLYLAGFRWMVFKLEFPSGFMSGAAVDPSYFSSAFGGGIVKSPAEFFITNIFFLILIITLYRYLVSYIELRRVKSQPGISKFVLLLVPSIGLFLLAIRGLSSSIKSVIFDSTLRYFKDPELIPTFPALVMNLNILLLGVSAVLFLVGIVLLIFSYWKQPKEKNSKLNFLFLFLLFQTCGLLFIIFQKQPLITLPFSLLFISVIFVLSFHIYFKNIGSIYNYVLITIVSSMMTITLLNYFNSDLERETLKTTAIELNRADDNLFKFFLNEVLENAVQNEQTVNSFIRRNTNYDATAFIIWSRSLLQRESLNSYVAILDKQKKLLGSFTLNSESDVDFNKIVKTVSTNYQMTEVSKSNSKRKIYSGILPVLDREFHLGYVFVSIIINEGIIAEDVIPEFLSSKKNLFVSALNLQQIKVFEFVDDELMSVYGDILPSTRQVIPILKADFNKFNEAWLNLKLLEDSYLVYALRLKSEIGIKITAVALKEKELSWNLFNFFKLFLIHSILILLFTVVIFSLKWHAIKFGFRSQLLAALLFVSLIPLIILAVYNRQLISAKSESAIQSELNDRADYLENHIIIQHTKHPEREPLKIFENAGKELGINFSIYSRERLLFNSKPQYYSSGLFALALNPQAHYHLNFLGYREYLNSEHIDAYKYHAFYKPFVLNGSTYILSVNDAFDSVKLAISAIDIDVFLFGMYSFAILIIVVISTILASRISSPLRALTKATGAVAHGDFNVKIDSSERGEVRELIEGFNKMTDELRKNQIEIAQLERENAWKEMAKQVAHEIKNPLTPMKLAVQQLIAGFKDKNNKFEEMFERLTSTILNQIESLSQIADEFSRFAKMPTIKLEIVDLISSINDSVNLFIDEKIKIDFTPQMQHALVNADQSQLKRMFINLIRNSIQAESSLMNIEIEKEKDSFKIFVRDNGKGIEKEILSKIFLIDFTTKRKGMGLGLKLAKRFLEGVEGTISVYETSEKGTTFLIVIPAVKE